jgi:hypothetical protein
METLICEESYATQAEEGEVAQKKFPSRDSLDEDHELAQSCSHASANIDGM